jgi:hypothetical protein
MNKTIWKFELAIDNKSVILMPKGAEILSVQLQNNSPVIWAQVNPTELDKEPRVFEMFGTGHPVPCDIGIDRKFLGTIQPIENGFSFAFHIFERIN